MLDEVQVLLTVYEVNPTLSPISTVGNQVERIFIPPSTFKNHSKTFFLVANASNSETCSRISVQGSNTDFDATFGPSLKLMLQSQDFSYGLLASIRNLPKNASICYTSNKQGSDDVKVTSISIEDIDLNVNGIILCIAFSLIVFGFFFALTYLPRFWPHCTKSCSNPDEERSEESNDDQEDNQTPLQDHAYDKRTDPKRQSKKKQHKRLYKTLVSLIMIAFIGSVIANIVYYFHLFDMDGDQDKCYFNEKCLVPNHINKVLSNLQFGLYGIALILAPIFSLKVCKLEQVSSGMGILLILQGLNSRLTIFVQDKTLCSLLGFQCISSSVFVSMWFSTIWFPNMPKPKSSFVVLYQPFQWLWRSWDRSKSYQEALGAGFWRSWYWDFWWHWLQIWYYITKMERKLLFGTIAIPHLGHFGVGSRINCCLLLSSQKFWYQSNFSHVKRT